MHHLHLRMAVLMDASSRGKWILSSSWFCSMSLCIWSLLCSILAICVASTLVMHSQRAGALDGVYPPSFHSLPSSMKYPLVRWAAFLRSASEVLSVIPRMASTTSTKIHSSLKHSRNVLCRVVGGISIVNKSYVRPLASSQSGATDHALPSLSMWGCSSSFLLKPSLTRLI